MDRTHLRWFTQGSYRLMFEDVGIRVERIDPMASPGPVGKLFNLVTLGRFWHLDHEPDLHHQARNITPCAVRAGLVISGGAA